MATQLSTAPRTHNSYTVGWVCALAKEQTAATAMLDQIHSDLSKPPNDHNAYTLGSIGEHNIVIACLPKGKYGTISAANVATWMVSTFPSIKVGLMVGIGGGIPPMVRLGDVVVSAPIDQYPGVVQWDMGKAEKGGNFKRTGALNNPPSALLTALTKLETKHEMCGSKIPQYLDDLGKNWPNLVPKYTRSESLQDPFLTPDDSQRTQGKWRAILSLIWVKMLLLLGYFLGKSVLVPLNSGADLATSRVANVRIDTTQRKSGDMHVHYGLIASGNQVIKDSKFRDNLNMSLGGHVLCVEMEAAGLMNDFPCIVIRGICDYADAQKNKDWQEHAAAVAAACAKELLEHVQPSDIDSERPVKDILDQVLSTVSETKADVRILKSKSDQKEDLEMLNWLTLQSIDYGPQHSDFLKRREPGTCQWLLDSVEYQNWLKGDKETLFCPGIPGAGKTILTSVVVHDLTVRFSKDQGVGIAYIYCNFQRQGEQNVDNLLLNLVKQLAEGHSSLPESVKSLYNQHKTRQTRPSLEEASKVLQSVAAVYSTIFLVVDALDECQASDGRRARFLSELSNFQSRYRANIFATSRLLPDIINHFKPSISLEVRASQKDVARYLQGHIGQLPSFVHQNQELQEEIIKGISEAVDGMFLLAQIYLGLLDDKLTLNDIRSALDVFRKQRQGLGDDQKVRILAQAYEQAMERINGQKLGLKNLAMKVLSWITCAKRPLHTCELQHALATKAGKSELDQGDLPHIEDMVSVCSGLVTVDEESHIIRLVHYTTQEYFQRTQQDWFPNAEAEITKICVTYLSFSAFESGSCLTDDEFEERLQLNKLYNYAAKNWGHHARNASTLCVEVVHFLNCEVKVEGSSQALLAIKFDSSHTRYSQDIPKQITGLHLAAYFGIEEAAKAILHERVGADRKNTYGRTPLSWAAEIGHKAVVKLLLEKGAEIESEDIEGWTPLLWAAANGHEALVKLLLEEGAKLEPKDSVVGQTPLSWAARNGHEAVVKLLLEKGAELKFKEWDSWTLLWLTAKTRHHHSSASTHPSRT
ncbi:hypothetical protein BKA63DRAFT_489625 [Paraphoma chrysanthemicola]|nr:hypothetical protein BKA63DRAFT_489625 [Paraphoma chrysanthemicola]